MKLVKRVWFLTSVDVLTDPDLSFLRVTRGIFEKLRRLQAERTKLYPRTITQTFCMFPPWALSLYLTSFYPFITLEVMLCTGKNAHRCVKGQQLHNYLRRECCSCTRYIGLLTATNAFSFQSCHYFRSYSKMRPRAVYVKYLSQSLCTLYFLSLCFINVYDFISSLKIILGYILWPDQENVKIDAITEVPRIPFSENKKKTDISYDSHAAPILCQWSWIPLMAPGRDSPWWSSLQQQCWAPVWCRGQSSPRCSASPGALWPQAVSRHSWDHTALACRPVRR